MQPPNHCANLPRHRAPWRLRLDGGTVAAREALFTGLNERIRDVRQAPDGSIDLGTDGAAGRIQRVQRAA